MGAFPICIGFVLPHWMSHFIAVASTSSSSLTSLIGLFYDLFKKSAHCIDFKNIGNIDKNMQPVAYCGLGGLK